MFGKKVVVKFKDRRILKGWTAKKETMGRFFVCQSPITIDKATFIGMVFIPGKQ